MWRLYLGYPSYIIHYLFQENNETLTVATVFNNLRIKVLDVKDNIVTPPWVPDLYIVLKVCSRSLGEDVQEQLYTNPPFASSLKLLCHLNPHLLLR